jgi:hypothetical protein
VPLLYSRGKEVVPVAGQHVAHAAAGIGDVAQVARDDVEVEVIYRLPRGGADVQPKVVAVGRVLLVDDRADRVDGAEHRGPLGWSRFEPGRDVASWDDQRVARRHRVAIPERAHARREVEAGVVVSRAERAVVLRHRRALRSAHRTGLRRRRCRSATPT